MYISARRNGVGPSEKVIKCICKDRGKVSDNSDADRQRGNSGTDCANSNHVAQARGWNPKPSGGGQALAFVCRRQKGGMFRARLDCLAAYPDSDSPSGGSLPSAYRQGVPLHHKWGSHLTLYWRYSPPPARAGRLRATVSRQADQMPPPLPPKRQSRSGDTRRQASLWPHCGCESAVGIYGCLIRVFDMAHAINEINGGTHRQMFCRRELPQGNRERNGMCTHRLNAAHSAGAKLRRLRRSATATSTLPPPGGGVGKSRMQQREQSLPSRSGDATAGRNMQPHRESRRCVLPRAGTRHRVNSAWRRQSAIRCGRNADAVSLASRRERRRHG